MIKFCKKCLFPDTKPDLYFDEDGSGDAEMIELARVVTDESSDSLNASDIFVGI